MHAPRSRSCRSLGDTPRSRRWLTLLFAAAVLTSACGSDEPAAKDEDTGVDAGSGDTGEGDVEPTQPDVKWTGKCAQGPALCDDGNPCTVDDCDAVLGCTTAPKVCKDDDACTVDACDVGTGDCKHVPESCEDGNACTTGSCQAGQGCVYVPLDCSDNDNCTSDGCSPLKGCLNTKLNCDDGITCTDDSCDPDSGCVHKKPSGATCCESAADCEDDNACTVHACVAGVCETSPVYGCCKSAGDCDDGNPCTLDTCALATGQCSNTFQQGQGCCQSTKDCDDGNPCSADLCVKGQCGYEITCCTEAADCDKPVAVGLCGASTCTAAGCGVVAKEGAGCCKPDLASTGFEAAGGWGQTIVAATRGVWQVTTTGLSTASNTSKQGVGAATFATTDKDLPGGQTVAKLIFDEVELPAGRAAKLTFWVRALLVGGSLGDKLRVRLETATGDWLVWQAKGSINGFQKVEVDLRGLASRPATRKVRVVFEVVPNGVKSTFTKIWLDEVSVVATCAPPAACVADKDCDDGLNATSEVCSEGACVFTTADTYCESHGGCNDGNACTTDTCEDFGCKQVDLPDCCTKASDCADTNPCTTDYCSGLKCKHQTKPVATCCFETKDCDDGNPCTIDQCPAVGLGCAHTQTDASCCIGDSDCDDNDKCTVDVCTANTCGHKNQCCKTDADCDDKDPLCTTDKCGVDGLCSWTPTNAKGCCDKVMFKREFDDGSLAGLTITNGATDVKWQLVTTKKAKSGKGALWYGNLSTGNYDSKKGTNSQPSKGTVALAKTKIIGGEKTTLSFALWMQTEAGTSYDKFQVWVDVPGKQTQVWNKSAKSFKLGEWQVWTVDLTAWAGSEVTLRFVFDTADQVANATEGVYLDDIRLERSCAKLTCNAASDCDDGLPGTKDACTGGVCVYSH